MDFEGEISLFQSFKCEENCPSGDNKLHNLDLLCNHVCYRGCDVMCIDDYDPVFQFEMKTERIFFMLGNTVSMLGLFLTFLTLCVFSSLRTVSGLCLMNLVTALFMAKLSFQVNPLLTDTSPTWCSIMAMVQHYFCLSAFHWTSVLAFDLYTTVKKGRRYAEITNPQTTNNKQHGGKSRRRKRKTSHPPFAIYFAFAWGFPWSGVVACIVLESFSRLEFHYGNHEHCGVFGDDALLYSLAIPLLVITLLNVCLFILIVCHPGLQKPIGFNRARKYHIKNNKYLQQVKSATVRKNMINMNQAEWEPQVKSATVRKNMITMNQAEWEPQTDPTTDQEPKIIAQHINKSIGQQEKREKPDPLNQQYQVEMHEIVLLQIYINISFLMAVTWICGFLAAMIRYYEIWILFIAFNMLQGVVMFKSVVLQPRVRSLWIDKVKEWYNSIEKEDDYESDCYKCEHKERFKNNLPRVMMGNTRGKTEEKRPLTQYVTNIEN